MVRLPLGIIALGCMVAFTVFWSGLLWDDRKELVQEFKEHFVWMWDGEEGVRRLENS